MDPSDRPLPNVSPGKGPPMSESPHQNWHRDYAHALDRPMRAGYLHMLLYLTDVDECSPCMSISPEPVAGPILPLAAQLAQREYVDLLGCAGSAFLSNLSVTHRGSTHAKTAPGGRSTEERKSVQVYFGHRDYKAGDLGTFDSWCGRLTDYQPRSQVPADELAAAEEQAAATAADRDRRQYLNDTSVVPAVLWADASDEQVRTFYGAQLNGRTRQMARAFGRL